MKRLEKILAQIATPDIIAQRKIRVAGWEAAVLFNDALSDGEAVRAAIFALEGVDERDLKLAAHSLRRARIRSFRGAARDPNETKAHKITSLLNDIKNAVIRDKENNNSHCKAAGEKCDFQAQILSIIAEKVLFSSEVKIKKSDIMTDLLGGDAVIFIDGISGFLVVGAKKWEKRAVMEPPTETVLRGPREGFIEDIKTNVSLLQRRLKTPAFAVEKLQIGRVSRTNVALCYVSTIADPNFVAKIRRKLKNIDIDALVDSHYLQPLIEPHPYSIFHQTGTTEKPDVAAAKILEGRVAIIVEGSPMVLTAPFLLIEDFQAAEDYYKRSSFVSFVRLLRFLAVFLAIFLPGFYVAIQVYHFNAIPVKFLITLLNAVEGIPLSPLPEVLLVLLLFEIIRESSVRMPRAVGMAMSIVGALVLGETAVKAGMISSPAVMMIALSSIALYTVPNDVGVITLMRISFVLLGGFGGLYGLVIGALIALTALVNFDSFGTPYLAPFAPLVPSDLKDALFRDSLINQTNRPLSIPNINRTRLGKK